MLAHQWDYQKFFTHSQTPLSFLEKSGLPFLFCFFFFFFVLFSVWFFSQFETEIYVWVTSAGWVLRINKKSHRRQEHKCREVWFGLIWVWFGLGVGERQTPCKVHVSSSRPHSLATFQTRWRWPRSSSTVPIYINHMHKETCGCISSIYISTYLYLYIRIYLCGDTFNPSYKSFSFVSWSVFSRPRHPDVLVWAQDLSNFCWNFLLCLRAIEKEEQKRGNLSLSLFHWQDGYSVDVIREALSAMILTPPRRNHLNTD